MTSEPEPKEDLRATFLAPASQPLPETIAAPKGHRPNYALRAIITAGVIILIPVCVIGANTLTANFVHGARIMAPSKLHTQSPKPHPAQSTPAYDLTGFRAAVSGTDEQGFMAALNALAQDDKSLDLVSAITDAPRLIAASNAWLTDLRPTNPPPAYQSTRENFIKGARMARRAGRVTLKALQAKSLALLANGAQLAEKARALVSGAAPAMPQGS